MTTRDKFDAFFRWYRIAGWHRTLAAELAAKELGWSEVEPRLTQGWFRGVAATRLTWAGEARRSGRPQLARENLSGIRSWHRPVEYAHPEALSLPSGAP